MADEPKKAWRVLKGLQVTNLEDGLNQLAADGYQVFKIEREGSPPFNDFMVIAFEPTLVAERASQSMQAMLGTLLGAPAPKPITPP